MPHARPISDAAFVWRFSSRQERVEQMHGVVQEIIVGFADPDVQLAAQARREFLPVLLKNQAQVVALPMLDDAAVDLAGLGVPQRHRATISAARPVNRIPRAPLLARHRPTVARAKHVFHLALVANRELDIAIGGALARSLEAPAV